MMDTPWAGSTGQSLITGPVPARAAPGTISTMKRGAAISKLFIVKFRIVVRYSYMTGTARYLTTKGH